MSDDGEGAGGAAARASQRLQAMAASRGRRRWKAVVCIVLLVLAGAVIGAGATVVYFKGKMYRRPPRPRDLGQMIVERMNEAVGLSAAESETMRERMDRLMGEVEQIRKDSFERIQDKFDDSNQQLRGFLGEDRYQKWEKYKDERMGDRRRDRKRSGHH